MNQSITSSWPASSITDPNSLYKLRVFCILSLALVFCLPLISVVLSIFTPNAEVWQHIRDNLLFDYLSNSFLLALGVGVGTLVLGVASAWLVTMCQFPGREWFSFLLILPMAIPAYIIAYTYTGIFDVAGPIQTWLRTSFGWLYGDYWFPDIRSLGGAITVMSLVLYPYVYLITRAALLEQSVCVLEVARTLGCGPWRVFIRVALPLIRPAIIVGLSLVLMETLADYGTVQYFGVPVFTTGIFRTWFGLDNLVGAAQLSSLLLLFVFALVMMELYSRRQQRFTHTSQRYSSITPFNLSPLAAFAAFSFCLLVLLFAFFLPVGFMVYWAMNSFRQVVDEEFFSLLWNSFSLALVTAFLAIGFAMLVSYSKRSQPSDLIQIVTRVLGLGYALPGTIIAIGVMVPIARFDQSINRFMSEILGIDGRLVLSGSLAVLIFAYLVRFLAVSINTVDAALIKVKPSMDEAAMVHGRGPFAILHQIHLPLIKSSMLTALLLVFVDVLKELPATLLLRPFNFNTLAVKAYELANEERLIEASSPALAIVITGLIPVIILSLSIAKSRPGDHASS